jgi:hypothetical protein
MNRHCKQKSKPQHIVLHFFLIIVHTYVLIFGLSIEELYVDIFFILCLIQLIHNFIFHLFFNGNITITNIILNMRKI